MIPVESPSSSSSSSTTVSSPVLTSVTVGTAKSETPCTVTLIELSAAIASVRWSARPVATVFVSPLVMLST